MRALALACLPLGAALAFGERAAAQNALPASPEHARHLRAVACERREALRAAWPGATPEAREAALASLRSGLGRGAPLGAEPGLGTLAEAYAVLLGERAGERAGEPSALERFAARIDLQITPGVIEPRAPGNRSGERGSPGGTGELGTPLTVRVHPLEARPAPGELVLSLQWIQPDGRGEQLRRAQVAPAALQAPGFDLYGRAPADSSAGVHHAVLQIDPGPKTAPVAVACVPDFGARAFGVVARVRALPDGAERAALAPLADELERLLALGLRAPWLARPADALALLEERVSSASGSAPARGPLILPGNEASPDDARVWIGGETAAPRATLLLVAGPTESAEELVFGTTMADAWDRAARANGWLLAACEVSLAARPSLAEVCRRLAERCGAHPTIAVARGQGTTSLLLALVGGGAPALDGLVLVQDLPAIGPGLPAVPTLLVRTREAPPPSAPFPGHVELATAEPFAFLGDLRLPALVASWRERRAAPAPADDGR